ncbi:hypothetical protein AAFN88_14940 [Pelagibius sp. CAU 1746]|uniref:hypothetical protein n=1 Tax=Pelagibius sp. CAU 1746 TaxID=3140370 RepID=UPI00325ADD18
MKKVLLPALVAIALGACTQSAPPAKITPDPLAFKQVVFSLAGTRLEGERVEHRLIRTLERFFSGLNSGEASGLVSLTTEQFSLVTYYGKGKSKSYDLSALSDLSSNPELGLYFFRANEYVPTQFRKTSEGKFFVAIRADRRSTEFSREYVMFATLDESGDRLEELVVQPVLDTDYAGEAKIFVIKNRSPGAIVDRWEDMLRLVGPDEAVTSLRSTDSGGVKRDESNHSVVFVFSRPLPPNAEVRVEHQFKLTRDNRWLRPYRFFYSFDEPGDFQLIESSSRAGGPIPRTITYRVFVDGTMAGERTVETY